MRSILLVFALIWGSVNFAQNDKPFVDELVDEFRAKLKDRGITHFFETRRYCDGTIEIFTIADDRLCASNGTYYETYLIWQEPEGEVMIKKIDNCGMFYSLPIGEDELFSFYESNREDLVQKTVKQYQRELESNIPSARTEIHPCKRFFRFYKNERMDSQTYRLFDLTNDSDSRNLNYDYNNQLEIVALDKKLDQVLAMMEAKFRRIEQ